MNPNKISWFTLATILLYSMSACEGGDTVIIQRTVPNEFPTNGNIIDEIMAAEIPAGEIPAGEIQAGEIPAGEIPAGEMSAGEMPAGEIPAGEILAGEIPAGEIPAGEIQAGEVIENCGLYSEASIQGFTQAPLDLLANSCVNCHNQESFRRFKLTFNASDVETTYSPEQVQEALNAIEPFITIGSGANSFLATRIIDGHSRLNFNANSPEYTQMVIWIDSLVDCN